jgi:hypothetical protein
MKQTKTIIYYLLVVLLSYRSLHCLKTQFKIQNSTNHLLKKSIKLKNLAKLPISNNKDDLKNVFKNEDFVDEFLIKKLKSHHSKQKQKEASFLKNKVEELSGMLSNIK